MTVNKKSVYKLTFEFTDKQGQTRQAILRTSSPEYVEDDTFERLFYNPVRSGRTAFLDDLPGNLKLTARGEVMSCGVGPVLKVLFPPTLAVVVIAAGLLINRLF